ncbi:PQQ-dependent sugar dehydrogenase [Pelagicoccus sp. SDUM812002]|uniref:PQQ-dependent sugar dehydrogenase n=1 Tax=Pelagicoccus sp. SDUM812002 TaxID=3041266 RepID=UPI00280D898A|nr:PQQ-dependent sugar dehydrogenase [Pelagicoccus sp. SDUM812002]MDQ8185151.1 PQQ-dependent sugar dehydrogenase [Pelagicoccus sp. SDUM812002]
MPKTKQLHRRILAKTFQKHLPTCLAIAATLASAVSLEAKDERPDAARFAKTSLAAGDFYEPTEMAILPNLDILITQRRGEILHYDQSDDEVYRVGFLDVYHSSDAPGVNAEEGLLGIAADPDFEKNNFIYVFYSPIDKVVNRLSRFVFKDRILNMESEKVILEFDSQRDICCHTGGSLAFGPDRLLYLSTGDNSTPFNERDAEHVTKGFSPLNDLPDKRQYDARRSAGNTNDLRGKIIRIRVLEDGTYEIPEGNLFPDTPNARPEIYTMGHRNPYRISVDPKTGTVYWGDVGPDATQDDPLRGPRGYDEMNRATEAGNYGWPLFVGDNFAYRDFDYGTGESGETFDAANPINDSAHNTGLRRLPPAKAPFIWYPYAESTEFPMVGSGGRNAMAGPVYYKEFYPEDTRLPDYYDGKVIMSDWIRNWFIAVEFNDDGSIASAEPFLENLDFSGAIDTELGPDGRLYVLEYGSGWFQRNPDSGLSRIDFISGNLPPKIESVELEKTSGKVPFTIKAKADGTDYEGEDLRYTWQLGDKTFPMTVASFSTTIDEPGRYVLNVSVTDPAGDKGTTQPIEIYAGNERPEVSITVKGNQSFYFLEQPVSYKVSLEDDSPIKPENAYVSAAMNRNAPEPTLGHKQMSRVEEGEIIVSGSDCRACHKPDEPSIGPSYAQIAERYAHDSQAIAHLTNKILRGGGGVWGEVPMPAHPAFSESDLVKVVEYVRSHATVEKEPSLPLQGTIDPQELSTSRWDRILTITANYTDSPDSELEPLSHSASFSLRPSALNRYGLDDSEGFENDGPALAYAESNAYVKLESIHPRGLKHVEIVHDRPVSSAVEVSVRLDSPEGEEIGKATTDSEATLLVPLKGARKVREAHDLYIVFTFETQPESGTKIQAVNFLSK